MVNQESITNPTVEQGRLGVGRFGQAASFHKQVAPIVSRDPELLRHTLPQRGHRRRRDTLEGRFWERRRPQTHTASTNTATAAVEVDPWEGEALPITHLDEDHDGLLGRWW
jgi:hypothetical protein